MGHDIGKTGSLTSPSGGAPQEPPNALDRATAAIALEVCASIQDEQQGGDGAESLRRVAVALRASAPAPSPQDRAKMYAKVLTTFLSNHPETREWFRWNKRFEVSLLEVLATFGAPSLPSEPPSEARRLVEKLRTYADRHETGFIPTGNDETHRAAAWAFIRAAEMLDAALDLDVLGHHRQRRD